jgi:hypothetical protein
MNLLLLDYLTHLYVQGPTQRNHQELYPGTTNNHIKFHGILPKRLPETLETVRKH